MPVNLIRFRHDGMVKWGVAVGEHVSPLRGAYATTCELIETGEADWRAAAGATPSLARADVIALSPVTAPARIICQGANYRQHMRESGLDPDEKIFNLFFEKSDCTINDPGGAVTRPAHVRLLDYEVELALVFRRAITTPVVVTVANLADYVFGIVIANDVTARDVQLPQMQFFKGKSYRGFCPLGPHLTVLQPHEFGYLDKLDLALDVNGQSRQRDNTANLVYKPAETITELSQFSDIAPGDILLTGTPSGCALRVPPPAVRRLMQGLLPERRLWSMFAKMQAKRPAYLRPGDVMTARITSRDGAFDLGTQRVTVGAGDAVRE